MKFKNRFEKWFNNFPNRNVVSKTQYREAWTAAEKPLLEIIVEIVEEDNAAFFSDGNHMHSLELRKKIAELLEKE
jgi:hypothetical protein